MGPGIACRDEAWLPPENATCVAPLCPRLASLLGDSGWMPSSRLLHVALWVGSRSLDAERFLLLFLAWARCDSMEDMRRAIGAPSTDAVRHRLRRLSDAIESHIARALANLLSEPDRRGMHAALKDHEARSAPGGDLRTAVRAAFDLIAASSEREIRD